MALRTRLAAQYLPVGPPHTHLDQLCSIGFAKHACDFRKNAQTEREKVCACLP